jgi:hypothetical protein
VVIYPYPYLLSSLNVPRSVHPLQELPKCPSTFAARLGPASGRARPFAITPRLTLTDQVTTDCPTTAIDVVHIPSTRDRLFRSPCSEDQSVAQRAAHWCRPYRCPNSAGRPFGPWHGTNLARSKHGPARSVTDPDRHGPFSGPGMGKYDGPRALSRPGPINGSAR